MHGWRSVEIRAHGDMAKWNGRQDTYPRVWKVGDPAYAPDRRSDALLRFLLSGAYEGLWERSRGRFVMTLSVRIRAFLRLAAGLLRHLPRGVLQLARLTIFRDWLMGEVALQRR